MKHLRHVSFALLLFAAVVPVGATETYDTRTGDIPSWWRQPLQEDSARAAAREMEARQQKIAWLRQAPIGSLDYCAVSVIVSQKKVASNDGGVVRCFLGETSASELQANGWEMTNERRSVHPHSPGFEVEVVSTVVVKRQCVAEKTGALYLPSGGQHSCKAGRSDSDLRPSLFWLPRGFNG
ncbi:hypothetical protein [Variovorax sp. OV329]|uniref:hypothetical protein n=1 Tax=Variovorax sp. OV329 TaxID=1882825 RepID=UPI0008F1682E|nr:hypothetical protein [Variovorax sp. OV329]SFM41818.1 hypothetical protein SAMN05444747_105126 [Variovorax sp. OV329]